MSSEQRIAAAACAALVAEANAMTAIANVAARGLDGLTPEQRYDQLIGGFDAAEEQARDYATMLDELPLPDLPERDAIRRELVSGADEAIEAIATKRSEFADAVDGEIADRDVRGRVGQFFNAIEKANAVVEPAIGRYDRREFKQAFVDEPTCLHVVQPFRLEA